MDVAETEASSSSRTLFHAETPSEPWVTVLVGLAAGLAALLRMGSDAFAGKVWAEDGPVFLQVAKEASVADSVARPYEGYLHVVPRLIAELVTALPLSWQGVAMTSAAAATLSVVSAVTYVAVRSPVVGTGRAALVAAVVGLVPVGHETTNNVANLQWFLLFGGCMAVLASGEHGWRQWMAGAVAVAAVLTSPFGVLVWVLCVAAAALRRTRGAVVLLTAVTVSLVVQGLAIVNAPPRNQPLADHLALNDAVLGLATRVLGDGLLGIARHAPGVPHDVVWPGLLLLALAVARAWVTRQTRAELALPSVLVVLAVTAYLLPVGLSGIDTSNPGFASRYYVAPALFWSSAALIMATARLPRPGWRSWRLGAGAAAAPGLVLSAALLAAWGYGVSTTYFVPSTDGRRAGPAWSDAVVDARTACGQPVPPGQVSVAISPPGWGVAYSCSEIVERGDSG